MRYNPQASLLQGRSVTIGKHRRQLGGDSGTVLDLFWREGQPWLVLQLPSGTRTAVPTSWTDLPPDALPTTPQRLLAHPSGLLALSQFCRRLDPMSRRRRRRRST